MFSLDTSIPAELGPLSWLVGVWEGSGVIDYRVDGDGEPTHRSAEFGQRVSFSHDGLPYLNYSSSTWLLREDTSEDEPPVAHVAESGYWRLHRPAVAGDPGPGMLPGEGAPSYTTADEVETLRNAAGGFDIEAAIIHPTGVSELYLGQVKGPRIDLATDAVLRTAGAKPYAAATRLYGLVDGHLLWAWDMAALGQDRRTHASARLARVD
ncbi:MAG TPA: FABP family protein [Microbacteriaceae bacterium]|nr:FABP family protein [Microbacteriaceae bacterium]